MQNTFVPLQKAGKFLEFPPKFEEGGRIILESFKKCRNYSRILQDTEEIEYNTVPYLFPPSAERDSRNSLHFGKTFLTEVR